MPTLYFMRHKATRKYLFVDVNSNGDAEFCTAYRAWFNLYDTGRLYYVHTRAVAENALSENPGWYNSSLENPEWIIGMNPADYEIVAVTLPE